MTTQKPLFRIVQEPKGFVVQILKKRFLRKPVWVHFISVYGLPQDPWYYSSFNHALDGLLSEIKWATLAESGCAGLVSTTLINSIK